MQPDVYCRRMYKAVETYAARRPGANANMFLSSCSGQINCFYLHSFYLGSPLLTGPHNSWRDKLDRHTCGYTHNTFKLYFICVSVVGCARADLCLPLNFCMCVCVCARRPLRVNQQVLMHVSESGLPAGLPA